MESTLMSVKLINYRSFIEEEVNFARVSCFIGANESGKTNLLEAIYHLSSTKQKAPFLDRELRTGAPGFPDGEISISYHLKLSSVLLGDLAEQFPELDGKVITLIKRGKPNTEPEWEVESEISQSSIGKILQINKKTLYQNAFKGEEKKRAKKQCEKGWFQKTEDIDLRKSPYKNLISDGVLELLKDAVKIKFVHDLVKEAIFSNIKIYKWQYSESDFLQGVVPVADLIKEPKKYQSVRNMFTIAGWKKADFESRLLNRDSSTYSNVLKQVKHEIDNLIKKQWTTHNNLRIAITHDGANLNIHLEQPGSETPPEYRSDGLKWFLTFLINFRARGETVSDFILLVDEPGLYLHPQGQKDALAELQNLSKENQIIYTTHQTFMINKNKPERVRIITRSTEKSGTRSTVPFFGSKVVNNPDPKNILTDRLLREALGFKVSDISPINEKNILVEGVFDREILQYVGEKLELLDFNETSIIACGRASEISKHASLYRHNDLKVVCFYDSDDAGKNSFKANANVKDSQKRQIRNFVNKKDYQTMEDLIPDTAFDRGFEQWRKKWKLKSKAIKRPRMKGIQAMLPSDEKQKVDMKHSLENCLTNSTEQHIQEKPEDFELLKKILVDLGSCLR